MQTTAHDLYNSINNDTWPRAAAKADYGLDGCNGTNPQQIYTAYQKAIRTGKATLEQLQAALGDGPALTQLIGTTIHTVWDQIP